MVPYVPTEPRFFHAAFLFPFAYCTSLSTVILQQCLSGSIRSHIKLSGRLPPALKHGGDRFSDYSENNQPSLLLRPPSPCCLSWQPGPGSENPDVMPAQSRRSPGSAGQRQRKHMTSVLCGAEPAQSRQHRRDQ